MRFVRKIVIVTGAASGIGFATARAFAAEGALVAVNDLDPARAEAAAMRIGSSAFPLPTDVTDGEAVRDAVGAAMARHGRIDVLVNNAGFYMNVRSAEMTLADWRRLMAVNLDGVFHWAQAVAAASMLRNRAGTIVNVASIAGLTAPPQAAAYAASKHGVVGLTKALAVDWAPYGLRVNAVCPGLTGTEMAREAAERNPAMFAERLARIPSGAAATPEDQANTILFLASDQAAAITGAILQVDGGTVALSSGYSPQRP